MKNLPDRNQIEGAIVILIIVLVFGLAISFIIKYAAKTAEIVQAIEHVKLP